MLLLNQTNWYECSYSVSRRDFQSQGTFWTTDNMGEDGHRRQSVMLSGRFTVVESVPGIWLQHICSVLHDGASPRTLGQNLLRETDVTRQGLRDVIDAVHLQIGLV